MNEQERRKDIKRDNSSDRSTDFKARIIILVEPRKLLLKVLLWTFVGIVSIVWFLLLFIISLLTPDFKDHFYCTHKNPKSKACPERFYNSSKASANSSTVSEIINFYIQIICGTKFLARFFEATIASKFDALTTGISLFLILFDPSNVSF